MKLVKNFLALQLISTIVALSALASVPGLGADCTQREMQFIGKVRSLRTDRIDQGQFDCWMKIEFSRQWPSVLCPLDASQVDEVYVGPYHCDNTQSIGSEVSGVLVQKGGITYID